MSAPQGETTCVTLLARLRAQPADAGAWQDFVERYRPRIFAHSLAVGLQPADAEDVAQGVLLKLFPRMRDFHYDPAQSFRAWLKTVTRHVLCDFVAERQRVQGSGDSAIVRLLEKVEARAELLRRLETDFDRELLEEALRRVQALVAGAHWEVFRLTALEGLSGAQAAAQLGIPIATVYMIKSRVQKLVRGEVSALAAGQG